MPTLHETQKAFCQALRNPSDDNPAFDHLSIYQHLVFNNIDGLLTGNFPVIYQLLGDHVWRTLIESFIQSHQAKTPYFSQIAKEFIRFLASNTHQQLPAFLPELADYEYAESEVFIATENESDKNQPVQIDANSFITLKSTARLKKYNYAVQLISEDNHDLNKISEPTYFLLSRDHQQNVRFLQCNALTYSLFELLRINEGSSLAEVSEILFESVHPHLPNLSQNEWLHNAIELSQQVHAMGAIRNIFPKVVS
ncbi:MAG: putative DNA-binding domain-containing protein [Cellvibrionales bacterium]|nr:putative DNA-binding domain-containing protein [Cellvibrionales bacterium]